MHPSDCLYSEDCRSHSGQREDSSQNPERAERLRNAAQRSTLGRELKVVGDFDRCVIRNKIYEFYTVRHQLPTIQNLHDVLRAEIDFHGGKAYCVR